MPNRGGSGTLQQFTADPHLARAIIGTLHWNPNGVADASFFDPIDHTSDLRSTIQKQIDRGGDQRADRTDSPLMRNPDVPLFDNTLTHGPGSSQLEALRRNTLLAGALGAIDAVIQALRDMPGRKSVVLFSDGFNLDFADDRVLNSLHRLVDRANRAGTLIYTMHAAGLQVLLPTAGDNPNLVGKNPQQVQSALDSIESNNSEQLSIAQQGLDYLASVTGGLAYFNGNDLNFGLERVMEDQRGYYLLGYSPSSDTFDLKKGERPFHHLKVLVNVKGLSVRSRSGFFGATDEEIASKPASLSPAEQLFRAMLSPFSSSDIHLRLTPLYSEAPGGGSVVRNLLDIDTRDLSFKTAPGGSSEALAKLAIFAVGVDNKPLTSFSKDYKFSFQASELERIQRTGFLYTLEIELPRPGGYQIRAAVRDEATLKLGSANAYLEVPDLRRRHLALTSVVLSGAQSETLGYVAARRQFQRGAILKYFCLLQSDKDRFDTADLEAKLRIVSEGRQFYLGPVKITELADHRRAIAGEFKLGSAIPTGNYFLQVRVGTRAPSKPVTANQWTDFEVQP